MTLDAVRGYQRLGGSRIWPAADLNYGLGTVSAWADAGADEDFWQQFAEALNQHPDTGEVWWQLCAGQGDDSLDRALETLMQLRALAPDASVYVSAQPTYSPGHVCPIAGPSGPGEMADIAAELVADHGVLPGPDMGVLAENRLRDNCHADLAGLEEQGQILSDFFG